MRWLVLAFILYMVCYSSTNSFYSTTSANDNAYTFYYPSIVIAERAAQVCLTIKTHLLPATVKITYLNTTCDETCDPHTVNSGSDCWKIYIPDQGKDHYSLFTIILEIETKDKDIKFTEEKQFAIHSNVETILETDRSVYKMGDIVKIRIVAFDYDFKSVKDYKISSLAINGPYPSHATVKEWHNISANLGLIHLEFQLAADTPEGDWTIRGDKLNGRFEVKKYIRPRFQVIITGPERIYNGSKSVSYLVCGKYSHGRNLKGVALLSSIIYRYDRLNQLKAGCAKFDIFLEDLRLNKKRTKWLMRLTANVTEDGTQQIASTTMLTYIDSDPFSYTWNRKSNYIKPKLPYRGTFSLTNVIVPLNNSKVELCYKLNSASDRSCSNFTLDLHNRVEFTIPPIKNITEHGLVKIQASVLDWPLKYIHSRYLTIDYSTSKDGIEIVGEEQFPGDCGSSVTYTILYNSERFKKDQEVKFKYTLMSREGMLTCSVIDKPKRQALNLNNYQNVIGKENYEMETIAIDTFELKIQLDNKVYPTTKLLVYYNYENEEIVGSIDVNVKRCWPNQVDAKWVEDSLQPGDVGTLHIKTGRGSLCSISFVSGSSNRIDFDRALLRFPRYLYNNLNCNQTKNETIKAADTTPRMPAILSMASLGATDPGGAAWFVEGNDAGNRVALDGRGSTVRSFFPETWFWDLVPVLDGEIKLERKLPDSITDWQGSVVCMSATEGFGVSDRIKIKGFKPFSVDILLPYSIKRNKEILHLPILVFNYLNHSLPIRVTLESNDDIVLVDGQDKNIFSMCLAAEDSYTHHYSIKATKLGSVNIKVSANVDPAYAENCAAELVIRRGDVVQKPLLVEQEGYPSGFVKSALLCTNDTLEGDNVEWNINIPEHVVADTIDGKVTVNFDILGAIFQNLKRIVVIPTGGGEQTAANLIPDLYAMQFLKPNNALTDKTKENFVKNLELVYQSMLSDIHDDGSFSAFVKKNEGGSMFSTVFAIRTLRQMKKYIFIDKDVINKAMNWVITHQLENGCFDPGNQVYHEVGLASSKNQTTALTSFVLINALLTNTKLDDNILSKAKECILNDTSVDKYTLAISSYALGLINITHDAKERLNKLLEVANNENNLLWGNQSDKSLSANIEITSYVLMSLLQQDPVANLGTATSIVRWLLSQMNPRGGFISAVDTIIGLESIFRYATLLNKNEPNVKISLGTRTDRRYVKITKRDRRKPEILPLTTYPNKVKAKIEGNGCVSIQAETG